MDVSSDNLQSNTWKQFINQEIRGLLNEQGFLEIQIPKHDLVNCDFLKNLNPKDFRALNRTILPPSTPSRRCKKKESSYKQPSIGDKWYHGSLPSWPWNHIMMSTTTTHPALFWWGRGRLDMFLVRQGNTHGLKIYPVSTLIRCEKSLSSRAAFLCIFLQCIL